MNQSIVVPIDGSEHSIRALDFAIKTANCTGDHIILVNVQPRFDETWDPAKSDKEIDEVHHKAGEELLEKAKEVLNESNIPYTAKIRLGLPTVEICAEAKESNARCIIMGSRGMGPDVSKALGSVGYGVIHLTPCPLTLIPANS
ncbi:universal stress protein [Calidifontibacillus oryziterrae]|uniref:universal stress protein n=1 Tax=Calidifontibacillus oryziterrae TaxID=1191699 RepID=UPI000304D1EE|nr:universal stress protein [Calidifontibacillus oryziterrae]